MQTKMIEIRDSGTCIAAMAIRMVAGALVISQTELETEHRFLRREGYPPDGSAIILMRLSDQKATVDPYEWPSLTRDARTMPQAHNWITQNWNDIESGDVVDVQYILNETTAPKAAEIGVRI